MHDLSLQSQYHVIFFDTPVTRAWVKVDCLRPFADQDQVILKVNHNIYD